jgi:hypothetical protein
VADIAPVAAHMVRVTAAPYTTGMARIDRRSQRCPTCGAPGVRIVYGYPDVELFESGRRGEVIIGGCVVSGDDPTHGCVNGHRWRQDRTRRNGRRSPWLDPDDA